MQRAPGRFLVALACDGRVRVMSAVLFGPADELRERHRLDPDAARLAAEGLVASVLLASHIKGEERLTVDVRSPAFTFVADVDAVGTLRGRLQPASVGPERSFTGVISVLKSLGRKELYRGHADVQGERFEGALQRYLTASQQVDARVRIEADVGPDGAVSFAAGLVVERLPDMPAEEFAALFDAPLQADFKALMTGFAFGQLAGGALEVLGSQDFRFQCSCSRERVVGMLRALGRDEVLDIHREQGHAEVTCQYCNERYVVDGPELLAIAASVVEN